MPLLEGIDEGADVQLVDHRRARGRGCELFAVQAYEEGSKIRPGGSRPPGSAPTSCGARIGAGEECSLSGGDRIPVLLHRAGVRHLGGEGPVALRGELGGAEISLDRDRLRVRRPDAKLNAAVEDGRAEIARVA